VKRHSEFRGIKETILNRPTVVLSPEGTKAAKEALKVEKKAAKKVAKEALTQEQHRE
jgi:hypothetical protein